MTAGSWRDPGGMALWMNTSVASLPHNDPHHQSRLSRLFPIFRPTWPIEALGGTLGGMTWMTLLAPKGTAQPTKCTAMYRATNLGPPGALSVLTGPIGWLREFCKNTQLTLLPHASP
jgi:hypothetical protein